MLNAGSDSLKFAVGETAPDTEAVSWVVRGSVPALVRDPVLRVVRHDGQGGPIEREIPAVGDHAGAVDTVVAWLEEAGLRRGIEAVGHRIVHGGPELTAPTLVDEQVIGTLEAASELAPLHNRPALACLRHAAGRLDRGVPHVVVFDTSFHAGLPPRAAHYPLPTDLAARHGIRRYGFHGLGHRWMWERYLEVTGSPPATTRVITLHLGSGCSAAAVSGGRSMDTSMGLTPLEGLMMRTRSGDVDPAVVPCLARREGMTPEEVEDLLNTRSGLAGIGGHGGDVRRLLDAEAAGDERATLALDMFCHRINKQVGAYLAVLEGADAVVFGGGVGEHAAPIRARVLEGFSWCGLRLHADRNRAADGREARISADHSRIDAWVLPVQEDTLIARDAVGRLKQPTT